MSEQAKTKKRRASSKSGNSSSRGERAEIALRTSQAQLAGIIGSAMDAIITIDSDQRIVLFNAAAEKMFHCSVEEALGQSIDIFVPDRFRAAHRHHVEAFGETNVTKRSMGSHPALYGIRPNGEEFPIEASISQIETNGQKLYTVILRDITERRRFEESIKFQSNVLAQVRDAVVAIDNDQRITYWNQGAEKLYGFKSDAVLGRRLEEFYTQRWLNPEDEQIAQNSLATTGAWYGESIHVTMSGEEIPVESSVSTLRDESGAEIGILAVIRDIAERMKSGERLREQAALLDHAQDAILVRDLENRILYWNKSAERIYGWAAGEVIGKDVRELLYKDRETLSQFERARSTVIEKGEWSGELHQMTREGKEIIAEAHWTLVRDGEGNPKSVLSINTNITEKKKLEHQFLRAQRMESLGTLAGGIAHDLNNILSPILMSIQLLQTRLTDPDSRELLKALRINAERGGNMVKQVLSFARGAGGERVPLQPRHLVREIVKILRETLPKSIDVEIALPEEEWAITGDATQIHQVLMNLCVNARDAMPEGGKLTIKVENIYLDENYARMHLEAKPGRFVALTVADTGTGIPAGIVDKIFEPFFTTKEHGKGTGLGLSTVLGIAKGHGGFVDVYSEIGKGTQFRIFLPALRMDTMKTAEEENFNLPMGHGELILVVDDEPAIREITKSTLKAFGYSALTASDGTEAIALFAQNKDKIKVVLTDMMMPYLDGPATIRALQRIDPQVKIIASSGLTENGRATEAMSAGVKRFLSKPYTAERLLTAISETLNSE